MKFKFPNLFEPLARRARRLIKDHPETRSLERKRARLERDFASGKITASHRRDVKKLLGLRRRRLLNRAAYQILRGEPMPGVVK